MSLAHCVRRRGVLGLVCAVAASAALATPSEFTVVSDPSMKGPLTAAARQFEKESGQPVVLLFVKPGQLDATLKGMSHPDLVLLPDDVMEKLIQSGHVQADTRQPIGQVGLAVVVRSGAAKPDVSTPEALKQVLGSAKSIVYGDPEESLGGRQAAQVIARLGMADRLKDRITLASGANPMLQVSMGAAELGLHAMHEALETSGVTVAGPVPGPLQPWTRYTMALVADAANESEARQLMDWLAGSAGRTLLQAQGVWRLP